jgi:glycosyltransferase involved in cell wall biosynthesis
MTISILKIKIKNKIWPYIKDSFYSHRVIDSNIVQNINYSNENNQKKLLICYLAKGYFANVERNLGRTVLYEIFEIIKVFSELGYCIDVIDCNDVHTIKLISEKKYHLIFGFGESFYQITNLQPKAISILYMTENHPNFSYTEEKKRLDYFYLRHGKRAPLQRSGKFYKLYHLDKIYSHVITIGETGPLKDQYKKPYSILPTGIINTQFTYVPKNHMQTRKNFIWLGSGGAIHKGLDLLVDIFKNRDDITLHVCGLSEKDKKILDIPKTKNIVEYGHINIKSETFLKLIEKCSYIILPSCSEGCATSVLTGMLHGLIPVVIKNTGFSKLEDNAIFLNDYKIEYINEMLNVLSNELPEKLDIFSEKVFDFARKNLILREFAKNFRIIICDILNKAHNTSSILNE